MSLYVSSPKPRDTYMHQQSKPSPVRRQAIIWTKANFLLIAPLGIRENEVENFVCEMSIISSRPQCVAKAVSKNYVALLPCFASCFVYKLRHEQIEIFRILNWNSPMFIRYWFRHSSEWAFIILMLAAIRTYQYISVQSHFVLIQHTLILETRHTPI